MSRLIKQVIWVRISRLRIIGSWIISLNIEVVLIRSRSTNPTSKIPNVALIITTNNKQISIPHPVPNKANTHPNNNLPKMPILTNQNSLTSPKNQTCETHFPNNNLPKMPILTNQNSLTSPKNQTCETHFLLTTTTQKRLPTPEKGIRWLTLLINSRISTRIDWSMGIISLSSRVNLNSRRVKGKNSIRLIQGAGMRER